MVRTLSLATVLALTLPVAAQAGTVTRDASAVTYTTSASTQASESIEVGVEEGSAFVYSANGVTSPDCTETTEQRVDCAPATRFIVFLLGGSDSILPVPQTGGMTLEAHAGDGNDLIHGTAGADRLFGDAGVDTLYGEGGADRIEGGDSRDEIHGEAGSDVLRGDAGADTIFGGDLDDDIDGGADDDFLEDEGGNDKVAGGAGDDRWEAGPGSDAFDGGDGVDGALYYSRFNALTITLAGGADDGEAGEGDDIAATVENAFGGHGPDTIVGSDAANLLDGFIGNDSLTGGGGADHMTGGAGNDTIHARDGQRDTIDCGEGYDTVFADAIDVITNCEANPDADADGHDAPADCAPADPKIHPGAAEVPGNAIDEDCSAGALFLPLTNAITHKTKKKGRGVRVTSLKVADLLAVDVVELRCKGGRRRGCAFATKRYTGRAGTIDLVSAFRKRPLKPGATVEIRVVRPFWLDKSLRLKVSRRGKLTTA